MDAIDPKKQKQAKAYVWVYILTAVLGAFGAFMMWNYISEDMARQGVVAPGMAAIAICCAATALASFYTAWEYWRDGGRGSTHDTRAINGRCTAMTFLALAAISAAYANYPLPFPSQADQITGPVSRLVVDDDSVMTKLDLRVAGRPFAYDCFHRKGECTSRADMLALLKNHSHWASVIPVGSTILSLTVDGRTIVDPIGEHKKRILGALRWLAFALLFGICAWGDWRGYAFFRKPLRPQTA